MYSHLIFRFQFHLTYLRFHLCTEDIALLLADQTLFRRFAQDPSDKLNEYKDQRIKRRTHALLGQFVIGKYPSVQHQEGIWVMFDPIMSTGITWPMFMTLKLKWTST